MRIVDIALRPDPGAPRIEDIVIGARGDRGQVYCRFTGGLLERLAAGRTLRRRLEVVRNELGN